MGNLFLGPVCFLLGIDYLLYSSAPLFVLGVISRAFSNHVEFASGEARDMVLITSRSFFKN
jgi:hypothetical protein